jgi:L-asparagine oxygenase
MTHGTPTVTASIAHIDLAAPDCSALSVLAAELAVEASRAPHKLASLGAVAAQSLPPRLLRLRDEIATRSPRSGWLIRGLPIDEKRLGPTPASWRHPAEPPRVEECLLLMIGQALGTVFAWGDQQGGAPVHNIVPTKGDEQSLLSSSSTAELSLHTEDAFFADRADFLLLLGLRNPDRAPTYVADVRNIELSVQEIETVRSPLYLFRPDESHGQPGPVRPSWGYPVVRSGVAKASRPSALIGGSDRDPWLRFDFDYIDAQADDKACRALDALNTALIRVRTPVALGSGELLIIDNARCAHGRGGFEASFGPATRWVKRINVAISGRSLSD